MKFRKLLVPAMCLAIVACSDDDFELTPVTPLPAPEPAPTPTPQPAAEYEFMITTTNLTNAQPMSPIGVALHTEGQFFRVGETASAQLEDLAESGMNAGLLGLSVVNASASSDGPLGPGASVELMVTTDSLEQQKLSIISMMVNTNDGFTGLNSLDVSSMAVGDTVSFRTVAYDAGTEANSEAAGTIPGPADGGEGFNAARDDVINVVAMHPGVVGSDDGLRTSVLNSAHKFDNPLLALTITRTK